MPCGRADKPMPRRVAEPNRDQFTQCTLLVSYQCYVSLAQPRQRRVQVCASAHHSAALDLDHCDKLSVSEEPTIVTLLRNDPLGLTFISPFHSNCIRMHSEACRV